MKRAILPILYQDAYLVAVNKPSGLLVHRSDIDRHETENAMNIVRNQVGCWVYPFHRLDRATSGVLLFGLDAETGRRMTQQFTDSQVLKEYYAVVRGYTSESERIDHPLRDRPERVAGRRAEKAKEGRAAVTEYSRLGIAELPYPVGRYPTARFSLVLAKPLSGRNHQIRKHMKHIFHPVIGDTTYGDGKQNDFFRSQFGCNRLLLHASRMGLLHPWSGELLEISAPLDETYLSLLRELKWDHLVQG